MVSRPHKRRSSAFSPYLETGHGNDTRQSGSRYTSGNTKERLGSSGAEMSDVLKYTVIFEKSVDGYGAYVPDLPGCVTVGETLEETERNIREAITGHLEVMRELGDPIPEPTTIAETVEITAA